MFFNDAPPPKPEASYNNHDYKFNRDDDSRDIILADARSGDSTSTREVLLADSRQTSMNTDKIERIGQIDSMVIDNNWQSGIEDNSGNSSYKVYKSKGNPDVKLEFFYRGTKCSGTAAEAFKGVLSKPDHDLSRSEYESLGDVLRGKDDPKAFKLESAQTKTVNGKRVLLLEGEYTGDNLSSKEMLIDSDGTGSTVQEVAMKAPSAEFSLHKPSADKLFKSIEWK